MNYTIIHNDYVNTGGNTMVHVSEVWLKDENRTVFVYVGDEDVSMHTVDYIRNDIEVNDYDELLIEAANWKNGDFADVCTYFDIFRECLFEYLKRDCKYFGYKASVPYVWLPFEYQLQITAEQKHYVEDELTGEFETDGVVVIVPLANGEEIELLKVTEHKPLVNVLSACLFRLQCVYERDHEFMDADDCGELLATIQDVVYYMNQNN